MLITIHGSELDTIMCQLADERLLSIKVQHLKRVGTWGVGGDTPMRPSGRGLEIGFGQLCARHSALVLPPFGGSSQLFETTNDLTGRTPDWQNTKQFA